MSASRLRYPAFVFKMAAARHRGAALRAVIRSLSLTRSTNKPRGKPTLYSLLAQSLALEDRIVRRDRPALLEPDVPVTLVLPAALHRLVERAGRPLGVSVSELLRVFLREALRELGLAQREIEALKKAAPCRFGGRLSATTERPGDRSECAVDPEAFSECPVGNSRTGGPQAVTRRAVAQRRTPASAGVDGLWSSRARGKRTPSGARAFKGLLIYMLCPSVWPLGVGEQRSTGFAGPLHPRPVQAALGAAPGTGTICVEPAFRGLRGEDSTVQSVACERRHRPSGRGGNAHAIAPPP